MFSDCFILLLMPPNHDINLLQFSIFDFILIIILTVFAAFCVLCIAYVCIVIGAVQIFSIDDDDRDNP